MISTTLRIVQELRISLSKTCQVTAPSSRRIRCSLNLMSLRSNEILPIDSMDINNCFPFFTLLGRERTIFQLVPVYFLKPFAQEERKSRISVTTLFNLEQPILMRNSCVQLTSNLLLFGHYGTIHHPYLGHPNNKTIL